MAAAVATADVLVLKNTQIIVNVDEALSDILVVSYFNENKRFQGVLLDSTKRNLPFGVSSLHPAFFMSQKCPNGSDDKLFSTSLRFAYQDPDYAPKPLTKPKQQQQRSKMTVRLRPRKVLCSKCKGICNENSENVAQTRKRKVSEQQTPSSKEKKVYLSADSTSRNIGEEESRTLIMGHSLIPKISRLHPNEITNALNGNIYNRNEIWLRQSDDKSESNFEIEEFDTKNKQSDVSGDSNAAADHFNKSDILYSSSEGNSENRLLEDIRDHNSGSEQPKRKVKVSKHDESKKKRSETFTSPDIDDSSSNMFSSARTLKISFGEGEGTVLKLPAMVGGFDGGESNGKCDTKASKRALKKAKKQARRLASPPPSPSNDAPFHFFQRKHKHKVKQTKHSQENNLDDESCSAMKEECLKHSVSISPEGMGLGEEEPGVGAVVWGKVRGFSWWPGKVVSLDESGAHVSWYASSTSSLMPTHRLSPFLDTFKARFNKKKRGPYKEAVRLAALDARVTDPLATDPLAANTNITPLSPTPIDVLS